MALVPRGFQPPESFVTPGPISHIFPITPSDTNVFLFLTRYIWVGGSGAIAVRAAGDTDAQVLTGATAGSMLQICADMVLATGTTATLLRGMY